MVEGVDLEQAITAAILQRVAAAETITEYRPPLVGFAAADDPLFLQLRHVATASHLLPEELLPGAHSVVSFFLPFAPWVVEANAQHKDQVAREWSQAYLETNALIGQINTHLIAILAELGIRAAAEPATHNYDPVTLISRWSHKSVAVIAGLGSFGLHQMVITDAGCAGRFGSLVLDACVPVAPAEPKQRCLHFHDGSCLECVLRCPVQALDACAPLDKPLCNRRLLAIKQLAIADACGKCAIGPCSFESAVP